MFPRDMAHVSLISTSKFPLYGSFLMKTRNKQVGCNYGKKKKKKRKEELGPVVQN